MTFVVLPDSRRELGALLSAHVHAQSLRHARLAMLHLLALAGGMCWFLSGWPRALPPPWPMIVRIGWPAGVAILVVLAACEWRYNARMLRITRRPHDRI